jgi:hypothetical protein
MTMHPHATFFAKTFTAIALLLSFGLVGQTCSTQSPTVVLDPDNIGGDDDDNGDGDGGGGGGNVLPDQEPSSPAHGSLILDGRPLILDAQPHDKTVDCHSVISIYYSESMNISTIRAESFVLSEKLFGTPIDTEQEWRMGDRLLIIEPREPLSPNTTYQLTAAEGPVDLDGLAYDPGSSPVIIEFTTAATVDNIAPEILASYPLDSSIDQPNDNQAVIVFSKAINPETISIAVDIFNHTDSLPGDYDTLDIDLAETVGDRVFSFDHQNDSRDLNANMQLDVSTDISDTGIIRQFMATAYTSSWHNMSLQRPQEVRLNSAFFGDFSPAANLANHRDFPIEVVMPPVSLSTDEVKLRVHQSDEDMRLVEADSVAGAGLVSFTLDLGGHLFGASTSVFAAESEMLIGAYTERNGVRTTVSLHLGADGEPEAIPHDLVPPFFVQFGPAYGAYQSQFRCTLPIVRPYGVASEAIGEVFVNGDSRLVPLVSDDTFFIGNSFDPGPLAVTGADVPFELQLTDAAGNPSVSTVDAVAHFSGFVGGTELDISNGEMRVIAIDKQNLSPISGATIHIEDFDDTGSFPVDSLNPDVLISGSDGAVTFLGRLGRQTVTVQRLGWQATTIIGINASVVSLPLTPVTPVVIPVVPDVTINNIDVGSSQINSNTLSTPIADADESMVQDYDASFGASVFSRPNQPGWFVSFGERSTFDSYLDDELNSRPNTYFKSVGLEEHVIVSPSTLFSAVVPTIEMAGSSNKAAGTRDYVYGFKATTPIDGPTANIGAYISTVIPGLKGQVVIGAGAVTNAFGAALSPPNGAAELEINLLNQAQQEGGSPDDTMMLNVYATDSAVNPEQASGMVRIVKNTDPGDGVDESRDIRMPDVPVVGGDWPGLAPDPYPFIAKFKDTLEFTDLSSRGMYEMRIIDSYGLGWNVIVMYSVESILPSGFAFKLPYLVDGPGDLTASIPLATDELNNWAASVAAYEMGNSFDDIGFFFDAVKRDRISWAKSASKAVVSF